MSILINNPDIEVLKNDAICFRKQDRKKRDTPLFLIGTKKNREDVESLVLVNVRIYSIWNKILAFFGWGPLSGVRCEIKNICRYLEKNWSNLSETVKNDSILQDRIEQIAKRGSLKEETELLENCYSPLKKGLKQPSLKKEKESLKTSSQNELEDAPKTPLNDSILKDRTEQIAERENLKGETEPLNTSSQNELEDAPKTPLNDSILKDRTEQIAERESLKGETEPLNTSFQNEHEDALKTLLVDFKELNYDSSHALEIFSLFPSDEREKVMNYFKLLLEKFSDLEEFDRSLLEVILCIPPEVREDVIKTVIQQNFDTFEGLAKTTTYLAVIFTLKKKYRGIKEFLNASFELNVVYHIFKRENASFTSLETVSYAPCFHEKRAQEDFHKFHQEHFNETMEVFSKILRITYQPFELANPLKAG